MEISVQGLNGETKIVEVQNRPHYSFFSTFLAMVIVMVVPLTLAYFGGYFYGKYQASNSQTKKVFTEKPAPAGYSKFVDKVNFYQIDYPQGWTATKKVGDIPGVTLKSQSANIELWFGVKQPITLSSEQKAAVAKTAQVDFKIDKQTAKMTEYTYSAGNYLSVIDLPAAAETPAVTFLVQAQDTDSNNQAKAIVQTFSF